MNWIVTVARNGAHLTRKAVGTFLKQDVAEVRVLLIDNASTDGTAEWSRAMYPQVVTLRQPMPLSVAASWNKGLSLIFDGTSNDAVLVCNNDVELRPDTYSLLAADGGPFVTGVSVGTTEDTQKINPASKRPHPDFSCFLIRRSVWNKVGKFNEAYKIAYCEDMDYDARMRTAGIVAYSIAVPFLHKRSSTLEYCTEAERKAICEQADVNRALFQKCYGVAVASPEYYAMLDKLCPPSGLTCDNDGKANC